MRSRQVHRAWRGCVVLAVLTLCIAPLRAQESLSVEVAGAVAHPGVLQLRAGARLADAVTAAQVDPAAYVLGAAWLRPDRQPAQRRLQAGLLYELRTIALQARVQQRADLRELAQRLHAQLAAMPVTGRRVVATLEPHALQSDAAVNLPLQAGDRLVYPRRPQAIRVLGAVVHDCRLPQVALRDARDYLDACPRSASADPDLLYVIQPDGRVFAQGVALWNRSALLALAPGAVLYVPLDRRLIAPAADDRFNADMAQFLATQNLPATEPAP